MKVRDYSGFCTYVMGEPYVIPGFEPRMATFKANALPTVAFASKDL